MNDSDYITAFLENETRRLERLVRSPLWHQWSELEKRKVQIESLLRWGPEPKKTIVLATDDGRVPTKLDTGDLGLDLGTDTKMEMWTTATAEVAARRFNATALGKANPVKPINWRDHFTAELVRVDVRLAELCRRKDAFK